MLGPIPGQKKAYDYLCMAKQTKRRIGFITRWMVYLKNEREAVELRFRKGDGEMSGELEKSLLSYSNHLEEAYNQADHELKDYEDQYEEIKKRILEVRPELCSDVLYLHYVVGMKIKAIADELRYTWEWIARKHSEGLEALCRNYPELR